MSCNKFLSVAALLMVASLPAVALPQDSNQPIRIQANSASLDERRNTAVYRGNVIITQGSMRLTGNQVTLATDSDGAVSKITSVGSPATYAQTPGPNDGEVNARAQTIEYFADSERIVLIDRARLEQRGNTFQGDYVSYDINKQIVDAGRPTAGGSGDPGRIEIVIQPRQRDEAANP
ncbi:lipopolysaccharide transport periplasmic protein LptA [uncultured Halopseudomonas sp.]|uniref:lipopolysaccharide transport periplasmic protein LptA n=1 Tax=uncultured Halopseudomonas sp. TaxID=2901193 RepID=UPI0030ED39A0